MNRRILLLGIFVLALLIGCATPITEIIEPIKPTEEPIEQVLVTPALRMVDTASPVAYEGRIVVYNATGMDLGTFDLFSEEVIVIQPYEENLLSGRLDAWESASIDLKAFPHLWEQIATKDGTSYVINARSTLGDLYSKRWTPLSDSWLITLQSVDGIFHDGHQGPGETIVVSNLTGDSLNSLYIEPYSVDYFDGWEKDLLGGDTIEHRLQVQIPATWVDVDYDGMFITAIADDGIIYARYWDPEVDSWLISLTEFDIDYYSSPAYVTIENQIGSDLWYIFITPDFAYQQDEYGEDLLEYEILPSEYYQTFYLGNNPLFEDILKNNEVARVHVFGIDEEDNTYYQYYFLGIDEPYLVFTPYDITSDGSSADVDLSPLLIEVDNAWLSEGYSGIFDILDWMSADL